LGRIAFYANGIESWDGETPYRFGIGASESSIVYLAEMLYVRGYDVEVYCPCETRRTIAGVEYKPHDQFPNQEKWDVFVASRNCAVLNVRRGDKQLFWAHDVPDAYPTLSGAIVDRVVCVSDWQLDQGVEKGIFKHSNAVVIPNGISRTTTHKASSMRWEQREGYLWLSQPERGLEDALDLIPEEQSIGVVYGFYNLLKSRNNLETFQQVAGWKYKLRKRDAKIYGRVGSLVLSRIMDRYERLVYPSSFPETFCVSIAQAMLHGIHCFIHENGATADTAGEVARTSFNKYTLVDNKSDYVAKRDKAKWRATMMTEYSQPFTGHANIDWSWDKLSVNWLEVFGFAN
jgi:glycosyltransferase involved in cell wall biosynthesis